MWTGSNPLAVLGIGAEAGPREIRDAYLAVVKQAHESDPTGEEFRRVQWAYVTLTDPSARARLGLAASAPSTLSPAAVAAPLGYRREQRPVSPGPAVLPYAVPTPEVATRRRRRAALRRWARAMSLTLLAAAAILGSGFGMYLLAAP